MEGREVHRKLEGTIKSLYRKNIDKEQCTLNIQLNGVKIEQISTSKSERINKRTKLFHAFIRNKSQIKPSYINLFFFFVISSVLYTDQFLYTVVNIGRGF